MDWQEKMKRTVQVAKTIESSTPVPGGSEELLTPLEEFTEESKHTDQGTWEELDDPHRTWEWLAGQWINVIRGCHWLAVNTLINHTLSSEKTFREKML